MIVRLSAYIRHCARVTCEVEQHIECSALCCTQYGALTDARRSSNAPRATDDSADHIVERER